MFKIKNLKAEPQANTTLTPLELLKRERKKYYLKNLDIVMNGIYIIQLKN